MSDRQGIEIDYCPKCRGIWLDRGELDKLIEKADRSDDDDDRPRRPQAPQPPPIAQAPPQSHYPPQHPQHQHPAYREDLDDSKYGYKYKRKKSWLSELFD